MPSRPYVRLNRGLMTPLAEQGAVGEQPPVHRNLDNSVYSAAPANSGKNKAWKMHRQDCRGGGKLRKNSNNVIIWKRQSPLNVFYCGRWKEAQLQVHALFVHHPDNRGDQRKEEF